MPAGAARNAVDCALWDLEAKASGHTAADIAGLATPGPLLTCYTLSLASPTEMAEKASLCSNSSSRAVEKTLRAWQPSAPRARMRASSSMPTKRGRQVISRL